jgi:hypothetical protein
MNIFLKHSKTVKLKSMNKNKIVVLVVLMIMAIFFVITLFYKGGNKNKIENLPPGTHGVVVADVIQTSNYTYLEVEENDKKFWIAVVKREAKKGDIVYYTKAFEMVNFVSRELNRTFPSVFFVQDPTDKLAAADSPAPQTMPARQAENSKRTDISVETPKGAITIAEIYRNKATWSGKTVSVRGVVVKYNHQIMSRNWVHIQDGTDFSGKFDLAITTSDSLIIGHTATFKGVIAIDKDFGAGYVYDVIMEEAKASDITK